MKIALPHLDHALGEGCYDRADDFRTRLLIGFVQMPTPDVGVLHFFYRHLEAVVREIDVVRRITLPDRQYHLDAFGEHLVAVLIEIAQRLGIARQRPCTDTKNKPPPGQVIEHRRVRGKDHRMLLRQIAGAGTELDGVSVTDQRGEKQQAARDVFGFLGQMLADKRIIKAQLVGEDDGLAIFMKRVGATALLRMHRHGEVT